MQRSPRQGCLNLPHPQDLRALGTRATFVCEGHPSPRDLRKRVNQPMLHLMSRHDELWDSS